MLVIPAIDLEAAARGSSTGPGPGPASAPRPTGRTGSPSGSWRWAHGSIHLVDFDGARAGAPANLDAVGAIAARVAVPLQVAGGVDSADAISLAFAAGATRVVAVDGHRRPPRRPAGVPRGGRRLARGRARPAAGAAGRLPVAAGRAADRRRPHRRARRAPASRRFVLTHGGAETDDASLARTRELVRSYDAEILVAGGVRDIDGLRRLRDTGVAGVILGEVLLSGAIDFPTALEAAA